MVVQREVADGWLVRQPGVTHPRLTLVCFPPAGAGASVFAGWRRLVPDDVDLVAAQLPGRENRFSEPPISSCAKIVELVAPRIEASTPGPLAIFGHSMGALLAFEVTRWLCARGRCRPESLVVSGYPAPHLPAPASDIASLPDAELIDELRRRGSVDVAVLTDPELAPLFLPALRADIAVAETYRLPARSLPLDVPVLALSGADDPLCAPADAAAWSRHTSAAFAHRTFPGGHSVPISPDVIATIVGGAHA